MGGFGHRLRGAKIAAGLLILTGAVALVAQAPLTLYVLPTDANGMPVTDLKAEEVAMSENGQEGKVVAAEKFKLPIHLTIGLDNGSGSDQSIGIYRSGLMGLVNALPEDVTMTVIAMAPTPRMVVKDTASHDEALKAINLVAPDENAARFTDTLIEFTQRLEKDSKDSKDGRLNYSPYLLIVSTTAAEATAYQRNEVEKAMTNFTKFGARLSVAMITTRASASSQDIENLNNGRQALIAIPLAKATSGKYAPLAQPSALQTLLPEWGKMLASIQTKQTNQYKLTIQRPAGATGNLNNFDMRFKRAGLKGTLSGDGRYSQ